MSNSLTKPIIHKELIQIDKSNNHKILLQWNLFMVHKLNASNLEQVMKNYYSLQIKKIRI